ncbi:hypothetical protein [Armatimonas rosea]|uniref:Uncharacterized protein n=1 Tax=Armatimonas rosea TaxID=685828 RepID=A0A7W9W5B4_ARMRO|nr:hypothetical protein [Armatimonas rosea]MBB6048392.1 hypothetical protein [Armatimonas rosea]
MGYLNNKDKFVAAMMALSTLGLFGGFCAVTVAGAKRARAESLRQTVLQAQPKGPRVEGLGALVLGSFTLALSRRMLRG